MPSRLEDWQLPLSRDEAVAGKFSGPNAPDSVALPIHPIDIHVGRQRWQASGPPGSTPVVPMASTKDFRAFSSAILAERLAIMSIALFVSQRLPLLACSLPVHLLDIAWQQRFISTCFESATIALLALGLIHLAIAFAMGARRTIRAPRAGPPHWRGPAWPAPSWPFRGSVLFSVPARVRHQLGNRGTPPLPSNLCRPPGWHHPAKSMVAALYSQRLQMGCRFAETLNGA